LLNEFNELSTYRIISCELTLIIYAFVMEGIGLTNWVNHSPDLSVHKEHSPRNFALFFFVTTLVVYAIGIAQYLLRNLLSLCKPHRSTEFVDLCSICNISFLMFDETHHGYYIHGRSPFGQAEITQEQLRHALYFEGSGKAQMRGMSD
jgi:meckelin